MSLPGGTDANESRYDSEMIAHIRSARAQAADDQWSIRLTLGEVDALLRAVDDRDDLKRRLVGEWEGDVPEPMPAVEVVPHEGTLGEFVEAQSDDDLNPCPMCGRPRPVGPYGPYCLACE